MNSTRRFFVVGSARSGTTLLQAMLGQLPGVHVVPETKLLPRLARRSRTIGDPTTDTGFDRLVAATVQIALDTGQPIDRESLEADLRAGSRSHVGALDALLTHLGRRAGARRVGEKTPGHLRYAGELLTGIENSTVIAIIRDGRDVAASRKEAWGASPLTSIFQWRKDYEIHEELARTWPSSRYTSVGYEDLVDDPETELRALCEFLNEPYTDRLLDFAGRNEAGFLPREKHKARTLQPVSRARTSRFRTDLSAREIAMCQFIAGDQLRRAGYVMEPIPAALAPVGLMASVPAAIADWLRRNSERREPAEET